MVHIFEFGSIEFCLFFSSSLLSHSPYIYLLVVVAPSATFVITHGMCECAFRIFRFITEYDKTVGKQTKNGKRRQKAKYRKTKPQLKISKIYSFDCFVLLIFVDPS